MVGSAHASLRLSALFTALLFALSLAAVEIAAVLGRAGLFDRGVIAYISECAYRTEDLFQQDIAHQTRMLLSSRYDRIYSLSYSPDGARLVFEAAEREDQAFDRHVYALDLQTLREYTLAPEYISLNGTPLHWQPDGRHLELRMVGQAGTGVGLANIVVDVASGDVVTAVPIPETFRTVESGTGDRLAGRIILPVLASNAAGTINNLVDVDVSARGDVVRSRMTGRDFDLYVQYAGSSPLVQITNDPCIERYPRWQP